VNDTANAARRGRQIWNLRLYRRHALLAQHLTVFVDLATHDDRRIIDHTDMLAHDRLLADHDLLVDLDFLFVDDNDVFLDFLFAAFAAQFLDQQ
jgi:hypothetical protein